MMGSLSEILASGKPFSRKEINYIYSEILRSTREVTHRLSVMCGGRYKSLISQVSKINDRCMQLLLPNAFCPERWECDEPDCKDCEKNKSLNSGKPAKPYSYRIDEITVDNIMEVGGKMSRLCEIHNKLLIPIPDGFCLTSRCFEEFLSQGDLYVQIDKADRRFSRQARLFRHL